MAGLSDLPLELVLWVFSYVDDIADLLNLSLVCKAVNIHVEPLVYRYYTNSDRDFTESGSRSMRAFFRTLAIRPELALHVKSVDFYPWHIKRDFKEPEWDYKPKRMPDQVFETYVNAAKKAQIMDAAQDCYSLRPMRQLNPWESFWFDDSDDDSDGHRRRSHPTRSTPSVGDPHDIALARCLRQGIQEAEVIVLLSQLSRLEEMNLRGWPGGSLSMQKLFSRTPHGFSALKKLRVSGIDGELEFLLAELAPVLRLPSMRTLEAYCATDQDDDGRRKILAFEPGSLSLTNIFLEFCAFSQHSIANLLKGCKALEKFTYITGGPSIGPYQFTAPELREALLCQKGTLKYFYLDLSMEWSYLDDYGIIGSLTEFEKLEELTMDYGALRAHMSILDVWTGGDEGHTMHAHLDQSLGEQLPRSLQRLNIIATSHIIVPILLEFLEHATERNPMLTRLNIDPMDKDYGLDDPDEYQEMLYRFKKAGITFTETLESERQPRSRMNSWVSEGYPNNLVRWNTRKRRYERYEASKRHLYIAALGNTVAGRLYQNHRPARRESTLRTARILRPNRR
ncbi:uncharacterized protein K452DRAFT_293161 [Aplosporella prunicola CBS 121167]|uniref:Uncharacterized protein n=1 Tax=Aplosporella prunicola CBS 121167 TaxID=1176127 RepID=A0A6A6AU36_9PEZI|nr:uncharacterized protein K452DRAFT_293161 [Aplosporella prunicola CBS 121167]KAF2135522.1 hypothetical protein K452DRAFT_293161 [Aplosporella prunicola CBS 121167]